VDLAVEEKPTLHPPCPLDGAVPLLALMVLVSLYATYDIAVSLPKVAGLVYDFPVTESLGDMSLALPFPGVMTEEHVEHLGGQNNVGATLAVAPHPPGAPGRAE